MTAPSSHIGGAKRDFDIGVVADALTKCYLLDAATSGDAPRGSADVGLEDYLKAFHELCRFFKLVGPIFAFVARDIAHKIGVLERLRSSAKGGHYETAAGMVSYELDAGVVLPPPSSGPRQRSGGGAGGGGAASGARTLLRLHWALEFIVEFMDRVRAATPDERTARIALDVYERTLARHHPWLTRQLAAVAVHALPGVRSLVDVMCKHDYEHVVGQLERAVGAGRRALAAVDGVLGSRDLLDIP